MESTVVNIAVRCALSVAIASTLLVLPACKKVVNAAVERATGAQIDEDSGAVTIKSPDGDVHIAAASDGDSLTLPDSFPKDVQLPSDYRVTSVMDLAGAQVVVVTTPDATPATFSGLSEGMQGKGWKREMAMQTEEGGTLGFSKDGKHVIYYVAKGDAGGTDITINITAENASEAASG